MTSTRKRIVVLFAALATLAALLAPGPAQAKEKREMTVMARNLYLGASLDPAVDADTADEFFAALGGILSEFTVTDFGARSGAIANEILATQPDLIGLQEAAVWTLYAVDTEGAVLGVALEVDFLDILQQQLAARGLAYSVVAVSDNANIGPVPLGNGTEVRFQDRDVILRNDANPHLATTGSGSGRYTAQEVLETPIGPLSFDRGWAWVDGTYYGKKFRFVNTHLETQTAPAVQEAQAAEFLAGPAKTGGAVIAVGDFNSAADGSTTASYRMLTKSYFGDAWDLNSGDPGLTCCQNSSLSNAYSQLESRIDLVLTHAAARAISADIVGDTVFQEQAPYWPSDHAGVVAVIRIH
jgi:endonuclease/exonuclease/phosphatase family metal-dependent hydrolase